MTAWMLSVAAAVLCGLALAFAGGAWLAGRRRDEEAEARLGTMALVCVIGMIVALVWSMGVRDPVLYPTPALP